MTGNLSGTRRDLTERGKTVTRTTGHRYTVLNLRSHFNNCAVTGADRLADGRLNIWGNSLPENSLPSGEILVDGIPFLFGGAGTGPDNVRCAGQLLDVPTGEADWLHLLATAERRTEDELLLHYADGACDPEWLRVSDFWPATPHFGERLAFGTPTMHYPHHVQRNLGGQVWLTRVPVPRRTALTSLRLPDNPAVHVFALTVEWTR